MVGHYLFWVCVVLEIICLLFLLTDYLWTMMAIDSRDLLFFHIISISGVAQLGAIVGVSINLFLTTFDNEACRQNIFGNAADVYTTMNVAFFLRLLVVGVFDRWFPSVRLIVGSLFKYGLEFARAAYILLILWITVSILWYFTERNNALNVDEQLDDSTNHQLPRYYNVLNGAQYAIIHLTGDMPIADYAWTGKAVHAVMISFFGTFAADAIPVALFCAVLAQEMRNAREAIKQSSE